MALAAIWNCCGMMWTFLYFFLWFDIYFNLKLGTMHDATFLNFYKLQLQIKQITDWDL